MIPFHHGAQEPHSNGHFPRTWSAGICGKCLCPEVRGNGDLRLRVEEIGHTIVLGSINPFSLEDNIQNLTEDFNVKRSLYVYNIYCNKSQYVPHYSSPSSFTLSLMYWLILLFFQVFLSSEPLIAPLCSRKITSNKDKSCLYVKNRHKKVNMTERYHNYNNCFN